MRSLALGAAALLAAAALCAAQGPPTSKSLPDAAPETSAAPAPSPGSSPPPTVAASLDTTATTVGGRLHLRVEIAAAAGWVVAAPAAPAELGSFRVRAIEPGAVEGDRKVYTLTLVPTEPGDVQVPPIRLQARHGSDAPVEIASSPVRVHVASNLVEPTASPDSSASGSPTDARPADLKPAIVPPRDWRPVWIALGAAVVAFAAAYVLLRRFRRPVRKAEPAMVPKVPPRPAWEVALEELDRIVAERLVERGELRRQYDTVTEALRRYLENRWGVPALESTTDEVRRMLAGAPVDASFTGRVTALLGEADLVKFAKARPEPHAARAAETRARELVLETIPREEPKEVAA